MQEEETGNTVAKDAEKNKFEQLVSFHNCNTSYLILLHRRNHVQEKKKNSKCNSGKNQTLRSRISVFQCYKSLVNSPEVKH